MIKTVPAEDKTIVYDILPDEGIVSEEEWNLIQQYYLSNAPDSLSLPSTEKLAIAPFKVTEIILPALEFPLVTLIKNDSVRKQFYIGNRANKLYRFNYSLQLEDSVALTSPPSAMLLNASGEDHLISLMGIMDPNDRSKGEIGTATFRDRGSFKSIVDSLRRPVHFQWVDLNADGRNEFVVAEFGNYIGALTVYSPGPDDLYVRQVLDYSPGARRVVIRDINNDNHPDIIALTSQGDERIILFENKGNLSFDQKVLLRFPPVFGSSDFEIADFNNDGKFDILVANGDNADFSATLKPYHGVRIFLNDGNLAFREDRFFPMYGAFQAIPYDFDSDGDLDVAALAFFPDFKNSKDRGFLYFENNGKTFTSKLIPESINARWLVMDLADINQDGRMDLIVGALDFPSGAPPENYEFWRNKRTGLMILTNETR
jgi:hypothetical protein